MKYRAQLDLWPALPMREIDAAWSAGYFDGEGAVCMSLPRKHGGPGLRIAVRSTKPASLEKMLSLFGGRIALDPPRPRRKDCWCWTLEGRNAQSALATMHPYLTIKQPHAQLALRMPIRPRFASRHRIPSDRALVAELTKELTVLNQRGRQDDSASAQAAEPEGGCTPNLHGSSSAAYAGIIGR